MVERFLMKDCKQVQESFFHDSCLFIIVPVECVFNIQLYDVTTPTRASGGEVNLSVTPGVTQTVTCIRSIITNVILKPSADVSVIDVSVLV